MAIYFDKPIIVPLVFPEEPRKRDSEDIIRWPCGTWCYGYELHEYTDKSDDYERIPFDSVEWNNIIKEHN